MRVPPPLKRRRYWACMQLRRAYMRAWASVWVFMPAALQMLQVGLGSTSRLISLRTAHRSHALHKRKGKAALRHWQKRYTTKALSAWLELHASHRRFRDTLELVAMQTDQGLCAQVRQIIARLSAVLVLCLCMPGCIRCSVPLIKEPAH